MTEDEVIGVFTELLLDCFDLKGSIHATATRYEKDNLLFVGVHLSPTSKVRCTFDFMKAIQAFDKVERVAFSNWEKTTEGVRKTAHLRMAGFYRRILFLVNVYLKPTEQA